MRFLHIAVPGLVAFAACTSGNEPRRVAPGEPAATVAPPSDAPVPARLSGPLVFTAQPGWIEEKPANPMRVAQYKLPRVESDPEDAVLVVFYFGGEGGSRELNLERWAGQFEQPGGAPSMEVMRRSQRNVNGMAVTDVDLTGTFVAETMPGSGERVNKPGWRMLASIVEGPRGPYYPKLTGPERTVAKWEASYRAFVSDAKPGP